MAAPNSIHMFAPANHDALRIEKPSTGPLHLINRAQQFAFEGFALAAIAKVTVSQATNWCAAHRTGPSFVRRASASEVPRKGPEVFCWPEARVADPILMYAELA